MMEFAVVRVANNIQFFITTLTPFLGTQLVIISRQLGVISEAVNEVRFVLDSCSSDPRSGRRLC